MGTLSTNELDERIHQFMDRKTERFPELKNIGIKRDRSNLLTRVQDFVAIWPHVSHPRHSH